MQRFQHMIKRNNFFSKVNAFWHDLYDEEYALYDCLSVSENELKEMRIISERAFAVYRKTADILRNHASDEILKQLDFPEAVIPLLRMKTLQDETVIGRFDFVKTPDGFKILELNADTPTFIKECFRVNGLLSREFGLEDANEGEEERLRRAIRNALYEAAIRMNIPQPNIVFTSHDDHEEDLYTTLYLLETSGVKAKYVPLQSLTIDDQGLYDEDGEKIDILYRQTYPIEHLVYDEDERGIKVGEKLIQLAAEGKLSLINPPSAFLLQSKALQAIIWGLMEEDSELFTANEKAWIRAYFLPTYFEKDFFIANKRSFVEKPSFGREGDTVKIFAEDGSLKTKNAHESYKHSVPVYQQYVDLPKINVSTEKGSLDVHQLFGCFVVGGQASAIGIRAGGQITGNESYFVAVGINKQEQKGEYRHAQLVG